MARPALFAARLVVRAVRRAQHAAGSDDPRRLRRRFRPIEDWAEPVDGRPRRLGVDETISVHRSGRFADRDPLETFEGWRDPWRSGVVVVWLMAVGVAAALGAWKGRGPLAGLRHWIDE